MTYAFSRRRRNHTPTPTLPAASDHVRTRPKLRDGQQRDPADTPDFLHGRCVVAAAAAAVTVTARYDPSRERRGQSERPRAGAPGRLEWPSRRVASTTAAAARNMWAGDQVVGAVPHVRVPLPARYPAADTPRPSQPFARPARLLPMPFSLHAGTNQTPRRNSQSDRPAAASCYG